MASTRQAAYPYDRFARGRELPSSIVATSGSVAAETAARIAADNVLQANIDLKANIASPTFTGDPKAPTPAAGDNDTSIATTAFVKTQGYVVGAATWTPGAVVFATATTTLGQDPTQLFWDDTNNRLGIGTAGPAAKLDVAGTLRASGQIAPTAGAGVELAYTNPDGYVLSYDRTAAAYRNLTVHGAIANVIGDSAVALYTAATARLYVDAAGLVGIGTTGPAQKLQVVGNIQIGNTNWVGTAAAASYVADDGSVGGALNTGGGFRIFTGGANERLRIESGGNVGIGGTPATKFHVFGTSAAGGQPMYIGTGPAGTDTTSVPLKFVDFGNTVAVGQINRNGSNTVAYSTASDARLKEAISDTKIGLEELMRLKVRDYNFKSDDTHVHGLIAQEVAPIYPAAVYEGGEDPDLDPWMIDYGRLTPLLIRSIQQQQSVIDEQQSIIDALTARLTVLEGRS